MAEMQRWKDAGAIFAENLGSSSNKIAYNTPTIDSPYGKSRVFSGGTGYGHSLRLTVNRLSVSFKVKLTGNSSQTSSIVGFSFSTATNLEFRSTGKFYYAFPGSSASYEYINNPYDSLYHTVTVLLTGNVTTDKLYIDGVELSNKTTSGTTYDLITIVDRVRVGGRSDGSTTTGSHHLKEVIIFNRLWMDQEILNYHNNCTFDYQVKLLTGSNIITSIQTKDLINQCSRNFGYENDPLQFAIDKFGGYPINREDLGIGLLETTLHKSLYSACVFYIDAALSTLNENTSSAKWIDKGTSKKDATQSDVSKQPIRVYSNGSWYYSFDGINDLLSINNQLGYISKTIYFEIYLPVAGSSDALDFVDRSISQGTGTYSESIGFGGGGDSYYILCWRGGGSDYRTQYFVSILSKFTGNWYKCCLVRDASLNKYIFYIGNSTYTSGPASPVINVATTTVSVGGISGLHNKHMKTPIKRFAIFNKALSASEAQLLTT